MARFIRPDRRVVDVGIGYLVQPGNSSSHKGAFVDVGLPIVQRRLSEKLVWRVVVGGQGRLVWERGRSGWGGALQMTGELAKFVSSSGCAGGGFYGGARGDLAIGFFTEGALTDLGDLRVATTSMGLVLRLPGAGFIGFEHGKC